jgi:hypothetical protein
MPRRVKFTPYARRVEYAGHGRHHATARRSPGKWLSSRLRDLGQFLFGELTLGELA